MEYWKFIREKVGSARVIIPGVDVAIVRSKELLLIKSVDSGKWFLPGGLQELGESVFDTGEREVREELGINVKASKLVSVYSGSDWIRKYSNGDELQSLTFLISTHVIDDSDVPISIDRSEVLDYGWFSFQNLPENMHDYSFMMTKDLQEYNGQTIMR